jgi:hypothetical protein
MATIQVRRKLVLAYEIKRRDVPGAALSPHDLPGVTEDAVPWLTDQIMLRIPEIVDIKLDPRSTTQGSRLVLVVRCLAKDAPTVSQGLCGLFNSGSQGLLRAPGVGSSAVGMP